MSDQVEAPVTPEEAQHIDAKPVEKAEPEASGPKTYKLKNGKTEREVTEEELIELGRKGLSADQRWQEAARTRKEVEAALERFEEDPDKFLSVMKKLRGKGYESKVEMAKDILKAELARRTMTPEERERAETQAELEALKKQRDAMRAEEREARVTAIEKQYEQQWTGEIMTALDKHQFPKNKQAVARVAQMAQRVFDQGMEPDWDACVRETKAQMQRELAELIESAEDGQLLGLLGEKLPKRVAKLLTEGIHNARSNPGSNQTSTTRQTERRDSPKAVDLDDWTKNISEFGK